MTHLTSKERTGFTAKEIKIGKVLNKLLLQITLADANGHKDGTPYKINRKELIQDIQGGLGWVNEKTVYTMIAFLLSKGFIRNNFHTQFSPKKKRLLPNNDTLYELDFELISSALGKSGLSLCNPTLDKFNKP